MMICVYCSSVDGVAEAFFNSAGQLAAAIADGGHSLVYGGVRAGLMGQLARGVRDRGGRVVGVIPKLLFDQGIHYREADELLVTEDLFQRRSIMVTRADAFVALAGGIGTLTELVEIITLKHLKYHRKPIVVLNTDGFYNPLLKVFEHLACYGFIPPDLHDLYHVAPDAPAAFSYLRGYSLEDPYSLEGPNSIMS